MSEEDYQRGLRGGPERVSISDWDRWKDWKAGHDEYERAQEEELEAHLMEISTPEENLARINARLKALDEKEAAMNRAYLQRQEAERRREYNKPDAGVVFGVIAICLIIGFIAGYILKWIFGLPVIVTVVVTLALGIWLLASPPR